MSRSKANSGANTNRFAIFAIGQYGSRRLNFRDKLPMLLVYRSNEGQSSNDSGLLIQHIYDKLGQSILQQIQSTSVGDRMYEAMFRWGPMQGRSQLAMSDRDYRVLFSSANLSDKMATLTMRPIMGDASFARAFLESVRRDWESIGNAGLLDMLKESFNRLRWQSMEERRSISMDLRLGELRDLLITSEALVQTGAGSLDSLTALDSKLSQLEIAAQLVCKSSVNELRKDSDTQRRLAYLMHKSTWQDVLTSLESIEQEAIRSLDAFLSGAERRVRMPVSQMDSHGSNLVVE
jgi:glutamine synthetase adenylyltransferase